MSLVKSVYLNLSKNPDETRRLHFPAYSGTDPSENLQRVFQNLKIQSLSAIEYECNSRWTLAQRKVGDDMLICIVRGAGAAWIQGTKYLLKAGDCVHFQRGTPHSMATDAKHPCTFISIHYTAQILDSILLHEVCHFPNLLHFDQEQIFICKEACREYALRPLGWKKSLESLITRLLLSLIRRMETHQLEHLENTRMQDLKRVLPALELMRHQLTQSPSIPSLSRHCHLSVAQFRRVFIRAMKISPIQCLRQIRMEEACRLLRDTRETVETISARVGYRETASFANSFRELMKVSPGRYRKMIA